MRNKALVIVAVTLILATGAWASSESLIYSFGSSSGDGDYPYAGLIADKSGNLYGTTYQGGSGYGTVFELTLSNGTWTETLLHTFTGGTTDGEYPDGPLVFDKSGNLYGLTYQGGTYGYGTVFELTLSKGKWTESLIHSFGGYPDDGSYPYYSTGLIFDASGNLYGTTYQGGASNYGSVFQLKLAKGKWTESVLYSFTGVSTGYNPIGGLVVGEGGYFYGTTYYGGAPYNAGCVYSLFESRGIWVEHVILNITGDADGTYPDAGLAIDAAGNLYGPTYEGGAANLGTVFKLTEAKNKTWSQTILYSFLGGESDGEYPYYAPVTVDAKGNVYGTTYQGGSQSNEGTVWELKLTKGKYEESVLHAFEDNSGDDGYYPRAGLLIFKGDLYGTTYAGGAHSAGTVFEVKP